MAKTDRETKTGRPATRRAATPLALAASMAASSPAYATVIHFADQNVPVLGGDPVVFDLDGDFLDDLQLSHSATFEELRVSNSGGAMAGVFMGSFFPSFNSGSSASFAFNLAPGAVVGPSLSTIAMGYLNWSANSTSGTSYDPFGWVGADPGYLGVAFEIDGQTHYGWMQIVREVSDGSGVVVDWAYESTPDTPIEVASVPEPGTIAMIAFGAAGIAAHRRRMRSEKDDA